MSTKTNICVDLRPFRVPDVAEEAAPVHRPGLHAPAPPPPPTAFTPSAPFAPFAPEGWQEPSVSPRIFRLSEIPVETLHAMCDAFRISVFERAGKDPTAPEVRK